MHWSVHGASRQQPCHVLNSNEFNCHDKIIANVCLYTRKITTITATIPEQSLRSHSDEPFDAKRKKMATYSYCRATSSCNYPLYIATFQLESVTQVKFCIFALFLLLLLLLISNLCCIMLFISSTSCVCSEFWARTRRLAQCARSEKQCLEYAIPFRQYFLSFVALRYCIRRS